MLSRIITRTHYQVDEPAYLGILVRNCSSPTKSDYSERVALRLQQKLRSLGKDFNLAAAKYCVDLAKALELLTENNFWSDSAHILNLLENNHNDASGLVLTLSAEEQLLFFRSFLEHDGAAMIFFGREILRAGVVPAPGRDWNITANEMMEFVYKAYLEIMTDFRERVQMRELLAKRMRQPYEGKSGPHQCFVHLQTMTRIGLAHASAGKREYTSLPNRREENQPIYHFVNAIPDFRTLEKIVSNGEWSQIAARAFSLRTEARWTEKELLDQLISLYDPVMKTGVPLCPLGTLIGAVQIKQLTTSVAPNSREDCMRALRHGRAKDPKRIKFHVDRLGRPAFLVLS